MSIVFNGQTYYRTSEASKLAGIARSTLLRWTSTHVIQEASVRDRRGWRLFTQADVDRITQEAQKSQGNLICRP